MPSSIRAVFDPTYPATEKVKAIKVSDWSRKRVGVASLHSKISAAKTLLEAAEVASQKALDEIDKELEMNTGETVDLYTSLEGSWAAIEEVIGMLSLGQAICKRVAGDTPLPPVTKFAQGVVEEDEK